MNVLDPVFDSFQIHDSYACRKGKGTEAAILRALRATRYNSHFLKMDVRKYFDSIDHELLKATIRRRIKDPCLLFYFDAIIDSHESEEGRFRGPLTGRPRGIPIGNLTSQYFANHFLALLDHRAKEVAKVRYWIRYMDDILAYSEDRRFLDALYEDCDEFAREALGLELKPKIVDRVSRGAPFLGFLVKPSGIYLAARSRRRFRRSILGLEHDFRLGRLSEAELAVRGTAMVAHTLIARSRSFRYSVFYGRRFGQ